MSGRTTWWPKDAAWHRRERIVALGEEFGPGGPNVLDVLSAWAQEQRAGGDVRGGFRILAREAFVDTDEAQRIVERAAELGALDDVDVTVSHGQFTCRVSGWSADQERGRAAVRKAASRAASHGESRSDHEEPSGKPEPPPDESRSVPVGTQPDLTREEENRTPLPPQGERETDLEGDPPRPPTKNRQTDLRRYEDDLRAWSENLLPRAEPDDAFHAVRAAMGVVVGHHPNRAEVLAGVRKWRPELLDDQEPAAA